MSAAGSCFRVGRHLIQALISVLIIPVSSSYAAVTCGADKSLRYLCPAFCDLLVSRTFSPSQEMKGFPWIPPPFIREHLGALHLSSLAFTTSCQAASSEREKLGLGGCPVLPRDCGHQEQPLGLGAAHGTAPCLGSSLLGQGTLSKHRQRRMLSFSSSAASLSSSVLGQSLAP